MGEIDGLKNLSEPLTSAESPLVLPANSESESSDGEYSESSNKTKERVEEIG